MTSAADYGRATPLILTLNEEPNLASTLSALRWAERVVVLDSGSTDATESIARSFSNVSWFTRPFDTFSGQTLHGIHETGIDTEFVLALDADMRPEPEFLSELSEQFLPGGYDGGLLSFRYSYSGRWLRGSVYPSQIRLFRPGQVRISQEGHGHKFGCAGRIYRFRSRLIHEDRKPLERWVRSQLAYSTVERDRLREDVSLRLRDRLRRHGLMAPVAFLAGYVSAGGPLAGRAALRYAYERAVYEGLLSLRLLRKEEDEAT